MKSVNVHLMTMSGMVRFFPSLAMSCSPMAPSDTSLHEYLSIRQASSSGARTDTSRVRQHPSLEASGRPECSTESSPCGRCGGRSAPKISVRKRRRVEWSDRAGFSSQTGRCAAVRSDTSTWVPELDRRRATTTRRRSSFL